MQKLESDIKNSDDKAMKLVRYEIERNKNILSSFDKTLAKVKMILQLLLGMPLGLLAIYFYLGSINRFDLFIALSPSWFVLIIAICSFYNNFLSFNQQKEALKCENDFLEKKLSFYQEQLQYVSSSVKVSYVRTKPMTSSNITQPNQSANY